MTDTHEHYSQARANEQECIDELVDEYEVRREDGDDVTVENICRDNPDLIPAVCARLKEIDAANSTLAVLAASANRPEIPGYQILSELGRGGSAVVYRAMQLEMDREVAVKVFFPQLQDRGFLTEKLRPSSGLLMSVFLQSLSAGV